MRLFVPIASLVVLLAAPAGALGEFAGSADAIADAAAATASCVPGDTTLCLRSQRFKLEVVWGDFQGGSGSGHASSVTSDTGYFWFFNSQNVELVVKVLDGRGINGHFWVFYGALSNVRYELSVTDTATGARKVYKNSLGKLGSVADTSAFAAPAGLIGGAGDVATAGGAEVALADTAWPVDPPLEVQAAASTCAPSTTALCLLKGRFRVRSTWRDFVGNTGEGQAVALTADTGYFWFFNKENVELVVKVLDGRGLNHYFWTFFGALSNVEYQLEVTDTVSGRTRYYANPLGNLASVADTESLGDGSFVKETRELDRAVTKRISPSGGTIVANGGDGSAFTLEIPEGALLSEEDVTLTPVTAIKGLPFSGGLGAAVHIEPEALVLYATATLTIVPASVVPRNKEISFAVRGAGQELFLYPPLAGAGLRLPVLSFAGYGVARGSQGDIDAQAGRPPTSHEDQLAQQLAVSVLKEVRLGAQGPAILGTELRTGEAASTCSSAGRDVLSNGYRDLVLPRLPGIQTSCEALRFRSPGLRFWIGLANVGGCGNEFATEVATVKAAILTGQVRCYNEAFDQCVAQNDPTKVAEMLRWKAELATDGHGDVVDSAKLDRCVRFEIDFDSLIDAKSDPPPVAAAGRLAYQFKLKTPRRIPIRLNSAGILKGSGALEYVFAKFTGDQVVLPVIPPLRCTDSIAPKSGSTFRVLEFAFRLTPYLGYVPIKPPDVVLTYSTGQPKESTKRVCGPGSVSGTPAHWANSYYELHLDTVLLFPTYEEENWDTHRVGALYLRKNYVQGPVKSRYPYPSPLTNLAEVSNLWIYHTPQ